MSVEKRFAAIAFLTFAMVGFLTGSAVGDAVKVLPGPAMGPDSLLMMQAGSVFGRLPDAVPSDGRDTPELVALGKTLYFEKGLSLGGVVSCSDCHPLDAPRAGAENRPACAGAEGRFNRRNTPTTMNAGFHFAQFRDGRRQSLEDLVADHILDPLKMGARDPGEPTAFLKSSDHYVKAFEKAFPEHSDPVTFENAGRALAAHGRAMVSRGRFDLFLEGWVDALTAREKQGMRDFMNIGCIRCHGGPLLGGMLFQKIGLRNPYSNAEDKGRYDITQNPDDLFVFKVPSLRNAALTAPYFHDGAVETLPEAVDMMGFLQLDTKLPDAKIDAVVRFLTSLSDLVRTSAVPPSQVKSKTRREPPDPDRIPENAQGELIRHGRELFSETCRLLGPEVENEKMRHAGNVMACGDCHQENGSKPYGLSLIGAARAYPVYESREDATLSLEDRINGCVQRGLNGTPLPGDGHEMRALAAYLRWLGEDSADGSATRGLAAFEIPERKADTEAGEVVYKTFCMSCHGAAGTGYKALSAGPGGNWTVPPLWGENSFSDGSPMHQLLTAAAFIQSNMPLGTPWDRPAISNENAYDVGAYINSFERPGYGRLGADWPDRLKKPVDCPYPPHADNFPLEQHKYGPFQPILKARQRAINAMAESGMPAAANQNSRAAGGIPKARAFD